jgi:hypothetical protein
MIAFCFPFYTKMAPQSLKILLLTFQVCIAIILVFLIREFGYLDFVHQLVFQTEHNVLEMIFFSIHRWKSGEYLLH